MAKCQDRQAPAVTAGADSAIRLYFNSLEETLPIHNGRVFYGYPGILENAFFPGNGWQKGNILYDGVWYQDVSMMYDAHMDELIILHPSSTPIRLVSERVQEFHFQEHVFVRLESGSSGDIKTGFYQRMVAGPVTILAKRSKKIEENIVDLTLERRFLVTDQYYALKDGVFTLIQKQKTLLELLKEKRQGIVQHLKQQNLKFKREKEKAIIQMASFYNQPSN